MFTFTLFFCFIFLFEEGENGRNAEIGRHQKRSYLNTSKDSPIELNDIQKDPDINQWDPGKIDTAERINDSTNVPYFTLIVEEKNNVSNETSAFPLHHDGTTDIFRKGLIIYFVLMALLACYHIIKCWRKNELTLFKPPRFIQSNNNNCQTNVHNPVNGIQSENGNEDAGIEMHSILKITENQHKIDLPPSYDEVTSSTAKNKFDKGIPLFGD